MLKYIKVTPDASDGDQHKSRTISDAFSSLAIGGNFYAQAGVEGVITQIANQNDLMISRVSEIVRGISAVQLTSSVANLSSVLQRISPRIPDFSASLMDAINPQNMFFGNNMTNLYRGINAGILTGVNQAILDKTVSLTREFRKISQIWLPDSDIIRDYFESLGGPQYPNNMKQALGAEYDVDWLRTVLYEEGIPLYRVPNERIITRLRKSHSSVARRSILGREFHAIQEDCGLLIRPSSKNTKERQISKLIEEAIIVFSHGHLAAGMTLLSSVLDFLVDHRLPDEQRHRIKPYKPVVRSMPDLSDEVKRDFRVKGKPSISLVSAYGQFQDRIVLLPMLSVFRQMYEKAKGPYIRIGYSRNATAHRTYANLYTPANAAQSLLSATSLASYIYHW